MICIRGSPHIAAAGRTIFAVLMLGGTVFRVLGGCGVRTVGVGAFAAIITGVIAAVAGAVVILPCTVGIGTVAGTVIHQITAVPAVFVPITP